ncbi:MAG: hypothetical protein WA002_01220 [Candidatus Acidiferrales bacterium]
MAVAAFARLWVPRRFYRLSLIAIAFLFAPAITSADVQLRVLATDPPSPAVLGYWEDFSMRIGYTSDRPIRVYAEAYAGGRRVTQMTSGSPIYNAGTGEAFFWLAFIKPQHVDTIVITAMDGHSETPLAQTGVASDLTWTGVKSATRRAPADWVTRMQAEQSRREKAAFAANMNRPVQWRTSAIFLVVMLSIPTYFILQIVLLWRMHDGWRKVVAIPVVPMAIVVAYTIYAYLDGSNLFPLVLIFTSPVALIYLLVIVGVKRTERKHA